MLTHHIFSRIASNLLSPRMAVIYRRLRGDLWRHISANILTLSALDGWIFGSAGGDVFRISEKYIDLFVNRAITLPSTSLCFGSRKGAQTHIALRIHASRASCKTLTQRVIARSINSARASAGRSRAGGWRSAKRRRRQAGQISV